MKIKYQLDKFYVARNATTDHLKMQIASTMTNAWCCYNRIQIQELWYATRMQLQPIAWNGARVDFQDTVYIGSI
jgi:hypothetical protein